MGPRWQSPEGTSGVFSKEQGGLGGWSQGQKWTEALVGTLQALPLRVYFR